MGATGEISGSGGKRPPLRGDARILLVEDHPAHAELMISALRRHAEQILHVWDGAEALAALRSHPFDIVVLDIGLKDVSGLNVLGWMRDKGLSTPAIIVTAKEETQLVIQAMRLGAINYIVKEPGYLDKLILAAIDSLAVRTDAAAEGEPLGRSARGVFVGRGRELEELNAGVDGALAGLGRLFLLRGEPGAGKTMLAHRLADDAEKKGLLVLWSSCHETDGMPAYRPWIQVVRQLLRESAGRELPSGQDRWAAEIAQLVPEIRDRVSNPVPAVPVEEPDQARFRLFDSLATFLTSAAERQPLVVVIDDLHAADQSSAVLLKFIAHEIANAHLFILATYRDDEVTPGHPLFGVLSELDGDPVCHCLTLDGLDHGDVARYVEFINAPPAPEQLIAAIMRQTGGNPFFVSELMRLMASGHDLDGATPDEWHFGISRSVRQLIAHRLQRLSAQAQRILRIGAVIGPEFSFAVLQCIAGTEPNKLRGTVDEAVNAWIIEPMINGRYRFRHVLFREVLYDSASLSQRTALHQHVAEALRSLQGEDSDAHLAVIAHHFFQAAHGGSDPHPALDYALQAAEQATTSLAHEEAARLYALALHAFDLHGHDPAGVPDARARCELLLRLGEAQGRAGAFNKATEVFQQAASLAKRVESAELLARAALGYVGPGDVVGAFDPSHVTLLEDALRALTDTDSPLRVRLLARLAMALTWSGARIRRDSASQQAIEMAQRLGDTGSNAHALKARHLAAWGPDNLEERLALASEVVRLAKVGGDQELELVGRFWRVADLLESGERQHADAEIEAHAALAKAIRQPQYQWRAATFRALRALMDGRFEHAERLVHDALAAGQRIHEQNAVGAFSCQLFSLRRDQGRLQEMEPALIGLVDRFPTVPGWRCALASLYAELRQIPQAECQFERLVANELADLPRDVAWLPAMALLAEVCAILGDARRAALLYDLMRPFAERHVIVGYGAGYFGSVAHYVGVLAAAMGHWTEATQSFEAARASEARMGTRPWPVRIDVAYAAMLLQRGVADDREKAHALLEPALHRARELGMTALAERAQALIEHSGRAHPGNEEVPRDPTHSDSESYPVQPTHDLGAGSDANRQMVDDAIRAAARSSELMAHDEAVHYLGVVLEDLARSEPGNGPRRGEVLIMLSEALWRAGTFDRAREVALRAVDLARTLGDARLRARAALAYAGRLSAFGVVVCSEALMTLLEESLAGLSDEDSTLRALILARQAEELSLSDDHERRLSLAQLAVYLARRSCEPAVLAQVLKSTYWALWAPAELAPRQGVADEIVAVATRVGDQALVLEGRVLRLHALLEGGDIAAVHRELDACDRSAQELRQPYYQWMVAMIRGCLALMEGRLSEADSVLPAALSLGQPVHNRNAALFFGVQLGHLLWLRGKFDEIEALLSGLGSISPLLNHVIRCALASVYCAQGRTIEARNEFERLASHDFADLPRDVTWIYSMGVLSEVCAFLGDAERARLLYDELEPFADRLVVLGPVVALGSVSHCLGQLAGTMQNWDAAIRHFEHALAEHERLGAPHWLALTQVEYARMLLRRQQPGDRNRAQVMLATVIDTARELDLSAFVEKVRALLDAAAAVLVDVPELSRAVEDPPDPSADVCSFCQEGEFWTLAHAGGVCRLRDGKGVRYIAHLLQHPQEEITAMDLESVVGELGDESRALVQAAARSSGKILDEKAHRALLQSLDDLRTELDEARENDLGRERLQSQIEMIETEIEAAVGLGGRMRDLTREGENIRLRVTRAIRDAIRRITESLPVIGHHLHRHIRTGGSCSYTPDPGHRIVWRIVTEK